MGLSSELGAPNHPGGGTDQLGAGGPTLVSSWYDGRVTADPTIIVTGTVTGQYGNNSIFGTGPRVWRSGGRVIEFQGSQMSGGLR